MIDFVGAHISISGGVHKAVDRAVEAGCGVAQIFTRNSNQWHGKPISDDDVSLFAQKFRDSGMHEFISHDSYLINLAAPPGDTRDKSIIAFSDELRNCSRLGIAKLVMHPGSHLADTPENGLDRVVDAFRIIFDAVPEFNGKVLVETTAGQGTNLGRSFEEIAYIIDKSAMPEKFGVCFDTCHAYAAGYPIHTEDGYSEVMAKFDQTIGIDKLLCFHLNDSKKGFGSRVDRHEHIGSGEIGLYPFQAIMNDERFASIPKIIETPKGTGSEDMDHVNMSLLRSFRLH